MIYLAFFAFYLLIDKIFNVYNKKMSITFVVERSSNLKSIPPPSSILHHPPPTLEQVVSLFGPNIACVFLYFFVFFIYWCIVCFLLLFIFICTLQSRKYKQTQFFNVNHCSTTQRNTTYIRPYTPIWHNTLKPHTLTHHNTHAHTTHTHTHSYHIQFVS